MQDEAVVLTDDEVINDLSCDEEEARAIRGASPCDWFCDADGYYVRLANGPLFGNYLVPR